MASCSLGAPNYKIPKLSFGKGRVDNLKLNNARIWIRQRPLQYTALVRDSEKAFNVGCATSPTLETQANTNLADDSEETKMSGLTSQLIPNSSRVESLVRDICDTTSIAEVELKLGEFQLYIVRDLAGKNEPPSVVPSPPPVSVSSNKPVEAPDTNGSVSTTSLAIIKPQTSSGRIQYLLDKAGDEGLVILKSSKVGVFRRSKTIKGMRLPPACKEGLIVYEGQTLCYTEQLGVETPIKSNVPGEVIKILREDGDPVGYGDAVIAVLPSFPGIKKLQ